MTFTAAARAFQHGEVYFRIEEGLADETINFISTGLSYSFSAQRGKDYRDQRVTLEYRNGNPDGEGDISGVVMELQVLF